MKIKRNIYQVYIGGENWRNEVFTTLDEEYANEIFTELIKGKSNDYIIIKETTIFKGIDFSLVETEIEEEFIKNQITEFGYTREEVIYDYEEDLTTQDFNLKKVKYNNLKQYLF